MHLIYRSKKQTLPIVPDGRLAPYMTPVHNPHSTQTIQQKKSIEIILDKHVTPSNPNNQALGCYKPQRKTMYKGSKSKKS
jgi:hypothetical protein